MKWQIGLTDQLILLAGVAGFEPAPEGLEASLYGFATDEIICWTMSLPCDMIII